MSDPTFELVAQLIILRWQLGWMDTADTKKLITMGEPRNKAKGWPS